MKENNKKFYFTKQTEDDIVKYCLTTSSKEKNILYKNEIGKALKELINNVVQVYGFGIIPNISSLKEDCLLYLLSVLNKYDPNKGSKAFNYFTVITRHWFIFQVKKYKKQRYEEVDIDEPYNIENINNISNKNDYERLRENFEFKEYSLNQLELWKKKHENNEKIIKTLDALMHLIVHIEELDFLNKSAINVYLREVSGLETKDISYSIKKLKFSFKLFLKEWNNGKVGLNEKK